MTLNYNEVKGFVEDALSNGKVEIILFGVIKKGTLERIAKKFKISLKLVSKDKENHKLIIESGKPNVYYIYM